jgi:hypothetical protein
MWPPLKHRRCNFDTKYVVTTLIAVLALAISCLTTYVTFFRQNDDVSIVVGVPFFSIASSYQALDVFFPSNLTIINAGNRSVIISSLTAEISQPDEKSTVLGPGCAGNLSSTVIFFEMKAFLVKAGEMVSKSIVFGENNHLPYGSLEHELLPYGAFRVAFSDPSKKNYQHEFEICMTIGFTTADGPKEKTIIDFADYVDAAHPIGADHGRGDTISLVKTSRLKLPWN